MDLKGSAVICLISHLLQVIRFSPFFLSLFDFIIRFSSASSLFSLILSNQCNPASRGLIIIQFSLWRFGHRFHPSDPGPATRTTGEVLVVELLVPVLATTVFLLICSELFPK